MFNPKQIAEHLVLFEKRYYAANPKGSFLELLLDFSNSLILYWPSFASIVISDTSKVVTCLFGDDMKLPITEGQMVDETWNMSQTISKNEPLERSFHKHGFDFHQISLPIHNENGAVTGTWSCFYRTNFADFSSAVNEFKNELVQAISTGMQREIIFRFLAEKIFQFLSADHILITERSAQSELFFCTVEFKADPSGSISEVPGKEQLTFGNRFYTNILDNAQTYVQRAAEKADAKNSPFRGDAVRSFVVAPIISKENIIGTLNVGFSDNTIINKRTISLIEETAGYLSISHAQDLLTKNLESKLKIISEAESELNKLEKKLSTQITAAENIAVIKKDFLRLAWQIYDLCSKSFFDKSQQGLSSVVDTLAQMTPQIIGFHEENDKGSHFGKHITDLKTLIAEFIAESEEKILRQNVKTKDIRLTNRLTATALIELSTEEFLSLLSRFLFAAIEHAGEKAHLFFESRIDSGFLILTFSNIENRRIPKKATSEDALNQGNFDLIVRLTQILFTLHHVKFRLNHVADKLFDCDIIFKLSDTSVLSAKEEHETNSARQTDVKYRILIVEDEDSLRDLMVDILESRNFNVTCYGEAVPAIEEFKKNKFDLLITDLGLPGMDGIELASQIKAISPVTPIIMVTGWGSENDKTKKKTTNIDFLLAKPFNLADLLGMVQDSLKLFKS